MHKTNNNNNNNETTILCTKRNNMEETWILLSFDFTSVADHSYTANREQKTICSCSADHSTAVPTSRWSTVLQRPNKTERLSARYATATRCSLWSSWEVFSFLRQPHRPCNQGKTSIYVRKYPIHEKRIMMQKLCTLKNSFN